jgi:lantibiotic modifying enzyme
MADAVPRGPWLPILSAAGGGAGASRAEDAKDSEDAEDAGRAVGETAEAALAQRAGEALDELAAALAVAMDKTPEDHPGGFSALADGPAGLALFFHYLDQARPGQGHDERALAHLEAAIEAVSEMTAAPGLYGGFSGVAWVLEHLTGRMVEPPAPGEEDPGGEVAAALAGYLQHSPWHDEYDLIGGLVGFGVWGIERAPRALGEEAVASVVRRLGELAERRGDGITWRSPPERMTPTELEAYPQGNHNLGVAHGVPGVVGLLGEMRSAGLDDGQARELLAGAVEWLLAQRLPDGAPSRFPYAVAPGVEPLPSRLAWCYGDPGIALALLVAARAAGEPEWERQALAVARAAAERPREQGGIRDGGLCHGAAGLVHLYNRLFQATGDPLFRRESLAWTERLLDQRRPGEGIAGWRAWRPVGEVTLPTPELGWVTDPGFLTGAAGIGLALLAVTSPVEPAWDRLLLSSVPPSDAARSSRRLQLRHHLA